MAVVVARGWIRCSRGKFAVARERREIENAAQLMVPQVMLHCGIDWWMQGYSSVQMC